MRRVISGEVGPEEIGAFLGSLRTRGESLDELVGFARALRATALRLPDSMEFPLPVSRLDNCGTGGDESGTFNISTAASFVVAAAGVPVAKHGNRSVSSLCGSVDVLEALGVATDLAPADVARALSTLGYGFLFAQRFHPALKGVAGIRRALGVRTVFNLLGPLINPAPVDLQLMGVYDPAWVVPLAGALGELGVRRALVVCGEFSDLSAGSDSDAASVRVDELSLCGVTDAAWLSDGQVQAMRLTPEDAGLARARPEALRGGDARQNAELIERILGGEKGAPRDVVVLNAGAALWVAGLDADLRAGARRAEQVLDSGSARNLLARLRAFR